MCELELVISFLREKKTMAAKGSEPVGLIQQIEEAEEPKVINLQLVSGAPSEEWEPSYALCVNSEDNSNLENLPRILIQKVLGKGGQGIAYKAKVLETDKHLVIKMATSKTGKDQKYLNLRIQRETERYRQLGDHANVARMFFTCFSELSNEQFLAIEFCKGSTLTTLIDYYANERAKSPSQPTGCLSFIARLLPQKAENGLPLKVLHKLMRKAAEVVGFLQTKRIAHCDVSPANFVWYPGVEDELKLIDFGYAAKLESDAKFLGGTPGFYSPEYMLHRPPTEKSDIYSLGCVFFNLVTLTQPTWNVERYQPGKNPKSKNFKRKINKELKTSRHSLNTKAEKNLIREMLTYNYVHRPSGDEVVGKIDKIIEQMRRVKGYSRSMRDSAKAAAKGREHLSEAMPEQDSEESETLTAMEFPADDDDDDKQVSAPENEIHDDPVRPEELPSYKPVLEGIEAEKQRQLEKFKEQACELELEDFKTEPFGDVIVETIEDLDQHFKGAKVNLTAMIDDTLNHQKKDVGEVMGILHQNRTDLSIKIQRAKDDLNRKIKMSKKIEMDEEIEPGDELLAQEYMDEVAKNAIAIRDQQEDVVYAKLRRSKANSK